MVKTLLVIIRGGGEMASGVGLRLHRAGLRILITELERPLVVRRLVSFANAVFEGYTRVEQLTARRVENIEQAFVLQEQGSLPVIVDPELESLQACRSILPASAPIVLVDARMTKNPTDMSLQAIAGLASFVIGLGPGFMPGQNCHAVVETNRGHYLGRVLWQAAPQPDTGVPESVARYGAERVLRAPVDGFLQAHAAIGDHVKAGQRVATVAGQAVYANFDGVLRGLIYPGLSVSKGLKIGDVDPRDDPRYCSLVSDKSLAIGGGVLEAILARPALRPYLWASE